MFSFFCFRHNLHKIISNAFVTDNEKSLTDTWLNAHFIWFMSSVKMKNTAIEFINNKIDCLFFFSTFIRFCWFVFQFRLLMTLNKWGLNRNTYGLCIFHWTLPVNFSSNRCLELATLYMCVMCDTQKRPQSVIVFVIYVAKIFIAGASCSPE